MVSRRLLLAGSATWAAGGTLIVAASPAATASDVAGRLAALERRSGGRIGVAILDAGSGRMSGHRLDERFPLCSTHKALSAAFVLARVEAGAERLDRRIVFGPAALLPHAPVTSLHVGGTGMTIEELCAAAVSLSDNTAANLLLASFGGPPALTAYLRGRGDAVTRLDRTEPTLNEAAPGDPRDTTTPRAMAGLLRDLTLGSALRAPSRARLQGWLVDCQTGGGKLRAGLPGEWRIGDKTGAGGGTRHASNDVAVIWRSGDRAPLVVTAYTIDTPGDDAGRDALLAEIGRVAATA